MTTMTKGQQAAAKAQATLQKRFEAEALNLSDNSDISFEDAFVQVRKKFYYKAAKKRHETMKRNKKKAGCKKKGTVKTVTVETVEKPRLLEFSANESKQAIYSYLAFESQTLPEGEGIQAITMPGMDNNFEARLRISAKVNATSKGQEDNNLSLLLIERDAETVKAIRKNFKKSKKTQILKMNYPKPTKKSQQILPAYYENTNFVWFDFMGRFINSYYDAITEFAKTCNRSEVVFAVTIGTRGRGGEGAKDVESVKESLSDLFIENGYVIRRTATMVYQSVNNTEMSCLVFRMRQEPKNARRTELESQIAKLQAELSQLQGKQEVRKANPEKVSAGKRAWETRRKRYGNLGRKNKDYRPRS